MYITFSLICEAYVAEAKKERRNKDCIKPNKQVLKLGGGILALFCLISLLRQIPYGSYVTSPMFLKGLMPGTGKQPPFIQMWSVCPAYRNSAFPVCQILSLLVVTCIQNCDHFRKILAGKLCLMIIQFFFSLYIYHSQI